MPSQNACGENNAYTSTDYTNYYTIIPAQNVETAFWLESDRMLSLAFTPQSLEVQRKVVMEEFKLNYINQPYGDISHILAALCYKQHPYRWPTIGLKLSHIADATMDDVKQFFYRFYRPSNAILAITGNISWDDALRLTEKWYGDIPNINEKSHGSEKWKVKSEKCHPDGFSPPLGEVERGPHSSFIPPEPPQLRQRRKTVHRNVPHSVLLMAFHIPARMHPDFQVCDMISDVLANGKSARFWRDLVEGKRLFLSLDAYVSGRIDSGQLIIEGIPAEGVDMHDAEVAIWDELDRLRHELVPEQEIQKLKNKYEASSAMQCTEYTQRAERLAYFEMLGDASSSIKMSLSIAKPLPPTSVVSLAKSSPAKTPPSSTTSPRLQMVQNKLKPQIYQMNTEFLIKTSHWRAGLNDFSDFFNHFNQINHCFL
jgi:predicted Zn-dependent peptidase